MLMEGKLLGSGKKFAIIGSRFNEFITSKLIAGATDGLVRHDVKPEDITTVWVPGAFEIPLVAQKAAKSGKFDAIICVGAVIRGATSHYDYVCNEEEYYSGKGFVANEHVFEENDLDMSRIKPIPNKVLSYDDCKYMKKIRDYCKKNNVTKTRT